jgi:hypothetical protein
MRELVAARWIAALRSQGRNLISYNKRCITRKIQLKTTQNEVNEHAGDSQV